jgi:hypothetical protein
MTTSRLALRLFGFAITGSGWAILLCAAAARLLA